ncbi:MAG: hypothetical protein ACFFGZ_16725 [Candidatus Thorarchaeota archaeon]
MSESWLKEYHSRIMDEYRFSMERKDRVTDWAIGIFFATLIAYAQLLREQVPSIWRICIIVALLCFVIRLFSNSCLAFAYLKKWRYLTDMIEKHWLKNEPTLEEVQDAIQRFHYKPRTTEKRVIFVKNQLITGFLLLFLFPFFLLSFEFYFNPQDLNVLAPISFLIAYYVYEFILFWKNKALTMPKNIV